MVTRRQLLDAGLTSKMVERRTETGHLLRLHRGVYAVGHAQLRREGRWLAAVLAVGDGAALSHRSAAALHGIRDGDRALDVTTTRRVRARGVVVQRTIALPADDVTTCSGIPVTTVPRTLVDLAAIVTARQLATLLREADRAGRLDPAAVRTALGRKRVPGVGALRAALAEHERLATSFTRSELEDRLLALLDAHGLPRPLTNHDVEGMEVDACWPRERIVVETDGWAHHHDRRAFQDDRTKSARLTTAGYTVVRFTHADVASRPAWVAGTLRELLQRGGPAAARDAPAAPSPLRATMSDPCR